MKSARLLLLLLLASAACNSSKKTAETSPAESNAPNAFDYVNPFIGTGGHGHTYPGATMPFGMVQLSPDTRLEGWDGCGGYHYDDQHIYGFSHTHLQGTGVPDYCDILLMPTNHRIKTADKWNDAYKSAFNHGTEKAEPGYYKVRLDDYNIDVELTATALLQAIPVACFSTSCIAMTYCVTTITSLATRRFQAIAFRKAGQKNSTPTSTPSSPNPFAISYNWT
jgi:putative alpha-1,2-mannosidase